MSAREMFKFELLTIELSNRLGNIFLSPYTVFRFTRKYFPTMRFKMFPPPFQASGDRFPFVAGRGQNFIGDPGRLIAQVFRLAFIAWRVSTVVPGLSIGPLI
jgi:hypothetical protein